MALEQVPGHTDQNATFFDLVLHCTQTGATEERQLGFVSPPETARDVKIRIEDEYNIPVCVQTLVFESHVLSDDTNLECIRIRSGDTFHVSYYADGNCKEILEVISWFATLLAALKIENPSISGGISSDLEELLSVGMEAEFVEDLADEYFFPWLDGKKYANKLHFVHNSGAEIMMEVYSLLLRQPWSNCHLRLKYIEYGILRVLWNLSETFALRRLIIKHNGLQMCMKSLLRKRLEEGQPIKDEESPEDEWLLIETIGAALGILCKYVWSFNLIFRSHGSGNYESI